MNEFEWLRQTRALRGDTPPSRDLWPGIAGALEPRSASRRNHAWLPTLATAAVILLSVVVGVTAWRTPATRLDTRGMAQAAPWKPADPNLTGAAIELQAADNEIRLALQQTPNATFLKRIRQRTQAQQWRLEHDARRAP